MMMMRELAAGLPLPAGQAVALAPGGNHIMLMGVDRAAEDRRHRAPDPDLRHRRAGRGHGDGGPAAGRLILRDGEPDKRSRTV